MFWTRATASDPASPAARRQARLAALAASALALLLVGAATFSPTWQALEFKTFDVLVALTAPRRTELPVVVLATGVTATTFVARQSLRFVVIGASARMQTYPACLRCLPTRP